MASVNLTFEYRGSGQLGDYDAFVDLAEGDSITLIAPKDWTVAGAKLYSDTEPVARHQVTVNPQKAIDARTLKSYLNDRTGPGWMEIFGGNPGFGDTTMIFQTQDDGTATITNPATDTGIVYDYLVLIQAPNNGIYDFVDPGVRNRR